MNNIVIGQYIPGNSIIHKMDPRIKILMLIGLITSTFLVPNLLFMAPLLLFVLLLILITKIPISKVFNGLKGLVFLLSFTIIIQLAYTYDTNPPVLNVMMNMTLYNLLIAIGFLLLWIFTKKYLKFTFIYFLLLLFISFILQFYFLNGPLLFTYNIIFYEAGVLKAGFIFFRIIIVILFSSLLTWTSSPTDLNNGIESLIKPLRLIKVPVGEIAMMLSLVLRFVPTLLEESEKIMKAQASRGADFKEGSFSTKIRQLVSLLVPMFVVSFKRAEDLANAMESRGYVIGAKRTKLDEMKIKLKDVLGLFLMTCILCFYIGVKIWLG